MKRVAVAETAVSKLQSALDDAVCREHPEYDDAIKVYYGGPVEGHFSWNQEEDHLRTILADHGEEVLREILKRRGETRPAHDIHEAIRAACKK